MIGNVMMETKVRDSVRKGLVSRNVSRTYKWKILGNKSSLEVFYMNANLLIL